VIKDPEKLFKRVRYAKGDEPKNAISDLNSLKGKVVLRSLAEDQPVKERDIGKESELSKVLAPGMRAVTIKVEIDGAVAGFVVPGSYVDVIHIEKGEAKIILQKLRVLAVGVPDKDNKEPRNAVTLEVKADDAEKLTAATQKGKLSLALRRPDDK